MDDVNLIQTRDSSSVLLHKECLQRINKWYCTVDCIPKYCCTVSAHIYHQLNRLREHFVFSNYVGYRLYESAYVYIYELGKYYVKVQAAVVKSEWYTLLE